MSRYRQEPARGGWFVALLALVLFALAVMVGTGVLSIAGSFAEYRQGHEAITYEVQVCRGGEWSPSHDVAALPGQWAEVDAGECGVRWREVTP